MQKLPLKVIHYGDNDPVTTKGGVETFARNLGLSFESVEFQTPATQDIERVRREKIPVICDNQRVLDWPTDIPVIGFQHGVAGVKFRATRSLHVLWKAGQQMRAARRKPTLWVACAQWIAAKFQRWHRSGARHVIYHPIDVERFDGRLTGQESNLILHDARTPHKGKQLVEVLVKRFPEWRFEPLACKPEEVPDRMRQGRAFLHLSRYEGNSIVCLEAMAMGLPCCFTDVGLMRDAGRPTEVAVVSADRVFNDEEALVTEVGAFLDSLGTRRYDPRPWVLQHATRDASVQRWAQAMTEFQRLSGWPIPDLSAWLRDAPPLAEPPSEDAMAEALPVWMSPIELSQLTALFEATAPRRVLEWGSGGSTRYFLEHCPFIERYVSVEHHDVWANKVRDTVKDPRLSLHHVGPDNPLSIPKPKRRDVDAWNQLAETDATLLPSYVKFPTTLGTRFDLVFVDGRARCFCIPVGWELLEPGGLLVVHDAQRPEYHAPMQKLGRVVFLAPWKQGQVAFVRKPLA